MRSYYYQFLHPTGRVTSGIQKLSFENEGSAKIYLEQRYDVTVLKLLVLPRFITSISDAITRLFSPTIKKTDLIDFFHNLSVMQRSGIPLVDSIYELTSDHSPKPVANLAKDLHQSVSMGTSFSESLERHKHIVPETVRHLVRIGESSGTLDRTLVDAAEHLKRIGNIVRDTKKVMIYPAFVFISIFVAAGFWLVYVIPNIAGLFKQMRVELPEITKAMISLSENLTENLSFLLAGIFSVIYLLRVLIKTNEKAKYSWHFLLYVMPVSKVLVRSSSLAYITEYLRMLLSAGINIVDSIKIIEQSVGNEVYRQRFAEIRQGLLNGSNLSQEMESAKIFPGFVIRMIKIGEQSGGLDTQLGYLAEEYRARFDHVVSTIGEIIKPAVMLFAGGTFIFLIAAIFLPVYQLIGQVT